MTKWAFVSLAALVLQLAACATTSDYSRERYLSATSSEAGPVGCAATPPRQWAVVVGIDYYQDSGIPDLEGAVNDAWAFYHMLTSPNGLGVSAQRAKLLLNSEATREEVEGALGNFLGQACKQDQVFIYFAGHGSPEPGREDDVFLLVNDTKLDNMVGTAIPMRKLPDFLRWRAGKTGQLLMLVDACHSGNIVFSGTDRAIKSQARIDLLNDGLGAVMSDTQSQQGGGWAAISAAGADQYAQERPCSFGETGYSGGLFTCHLLHGLSGKADGDKDGKVTLEEVFAHLDHSVSRDSGNKQRPRKSGEFRGDLVLTNPKKNAILIPPVPEVYQIEERDRPLRPFVWAGAGLVVVGALASVFLNLEMADDVDELDKATLSRAEYVERLNAIDDAKVLSQSAYIATGGLAAATIVLWMLDMYGAPEDRDDAYEKPPWFQIVPDLSNPGALLRMTW